MLASPTRPPRAASPGVIAAAGALALLAVAGVAGYGIPGLALPAAAMLAVVLLERPAWTLGLLVGLVVLVEREDDTFLPALGAALYEPALTPLTPLEVLLGLAVVGVALDALRRGEPLRLPSALLLGFVLLALAIVAGTLTGVSGGASVQDALFAARQLPFLVIVPLLVFQLVRGADSARTVLLVGLALAALKATLGLLAVAAGQGTQVEGATITFYEPAANALALLAILVVVAALLRRAPLPTWALLVSPLLVASLALSFRRSFWVAAVLALLLVLAFGTTPLTRRLLVPGAALVAAAILVLSTVGFQLQGPVVDRAQSLDPSRIEANAEDRYRIDERANVLAELRRQPVTGLGLAVPWTAERALPVEQGGGRLYVHAVALWHWLKLGVLGLAAYVATMLGAGRLAWVAWRRHPDPLFRATGLAALCWLVALAVVETTASFTGVDLRFTVLLGAVLGLLAALRTGAQAGPVRA